LQSQISVATLRSTILSELLWIRANLSRKASFSSERTVKKSLSIGYPTDPRTAGRVPACIDFL